MNKTLHDLAKQAIEKSKHKDGEWGHYDRKYFDGPGDSKLVRFDIRRYHEKHGDCSRILIPVKDGQIEAEVCDIELAMFAANHIKTLAEEYLELEKKILNYETTPAWPDFGLKTWPERAKELEQENARLRSKFKDFLSMLDNLMEEARSLRDTESIELESFGAAEELVIILSRTDKEEQEARESLNQGGSGEQ